MQHFLKTPPAAAGRWLFVFAMLVFAFEVAAQSRADLQIKDARITPQSLMTGEAYDVAFTVRNGSGRAVEPYTTFSVTIPSGFTYRSASFEVTSGVTYACVAEGGAVACKGNAKQLGGTAFGAKLKFVAGNTDSGGGITIKVDPTNIVAEDLETNNTATLSYYPRPDLAVTSLTAAPSSPTAHQEFAFVTGYKNVGPVGIRYEELAVTLRGLSNFEILRTEPATQFPAGPRTGAEVKFHPGLLNPGQEGTFRIFLRSATPQKVNAVSAIRSYDSLGKNNEVKTIDNSKTVTVPVQ